MAYAIVRTDNMAGTDVRSLLVSVKYFVTDSTGDAPVDVETAIENGCVVKLGALLAGEREVFKGSAVAKNDAIEDVVLIASPEVMYDERKRNLDEYINEAGKICRGYHIHHGDIFSVTKEALANASPAVGQIIELAAGIKWNNVASATNGATVIGKIIAKDKVGEKEFFAIKVY